MVSDIERLRAKAVDARRLAKSTADSHDREVLHALADELELQATEIERGKP